MGCDCCDKKVKSMLCQECAEEGIEDIQIRYQSGQLTYTEAAALIRQTAAQGGLDPDRYRP